MMAISYQRMATKQSTPHCTVQGNRALWTKGNKEIKGCIPSEYTYGKDHRSDF